MDMRPDSDWLKAAHLQGKPHILTIRRAERIMQKQRDGSEKLISIAYFSETDKKFQVNVINSHTIGDAYGWQNSDWVGKQIEVYPTTCQYGADPNYPCIRIRIPTAAALPTGSPPPMKADGTFPPLAPEPAEPIDTELPPDDGDDIPF